MLCLYRRDVKCLILALNSYILLLKNCKMQIVYKGTKKVRCGFGGERSIEYLYTGYFVPMATTNHKERIALVDGVSVPKRNILGVIDTDKIIVYNQRQLKRMINKNQLLNFNY